MLCFVPPLLLFLALAAADGNFTVPSAWDGDWSHIYGQYNVGINWTVSWTSNWTFVDLTIQRGELEDQMLPNSRHLSASTYTWDINIAGTDGNPLFDLKDGSTFYFTIVDNDTGNYFYSENFNITDNKAVSSSSTTAPNASISKSPNSTSTSASASPNTGATGSALPSSSHSLSATTKIAIGVGVGVGLFLVLLFVALGLYIYKDRRRERKEEVQLMSKHWQSADQRNLSGYGSSSSVVQAPGNGLPPGELAT